MRTGEIELLAPAKDLFCGMAAIEHGADAVYIGAPRFSARSAAANSLADIGRLIDFAHGFHARVYIALNTVLSDAELIEAVKLIEQVYAMGADALIIQDMGLLECSLPPIPLHASTQTNNRSVEKVGFLEKVGFRQVVLARELSLFEIRRIAEQTTVSLECFVHGALCVSYSGQCYISEVMAGRSANRGECAQFCRHQFTLQDGAGRIVVRDSHLLSLKDLNLADDLAALIEAGVRSFKIEGRLKDSNYVKNITALYRQRLDRIIDGNAGLRRSSSGSCSFSFEPDAEKSFHRGQTQYYLHDPRNTPASPATPKSIGKKIGRVGSLERDRIEIITDQQLCNGDGLCYFNRQDNLVGFSVNRVEGSWVSPHKRVFPDEGTWIYRNYDVAFNRRVTASEKCRRIDVTVNITGIDGGLVFAITDEDAIVTTCTSDVENILAKTPGNTEDALRRQALRSGDTIFRVTSVDVRVDPRRYYPPAVVKELRREAFNTHLLQRFKLHVIVPAPLEPNDVQWRQGEISYLDNICNSRAEAFYLRHGATIVKDRQDPVRLMSCRYCMKRQLGICPEEGGGQENYREPFILKDKNGDYRLTCNCRNCEMYIEKNEGR